MAAIRHPKAINLKKAIAAEPCLSFDESEAKLTTLIICLVLGLAAGVLSGLVGIGGGVIIVPALVFMLGFSQQKAQGTTIALMIPPIGILAALTYYREGFVDTKVAAFICLGFLVGGLIGARFATGLSEVALERIFGIALLLIALKMLVMK
jgi:uncharacterized membrane protein YfcA